MNYRTLLFATLDALLGLASKYASGTPDPTDDLVVAALQALLVKLKNAQSKADVVAACEHARSHVETLA